MSSIPIIDFENCKIGNENGVDEKSMKEVGKELYKAFQTCGFAYLKNPGIDFKKVDLANKVTEEFFSASYEEKKKFLRRLDNHGYVPVFFEKVSSTGPRDYKEAFNINGYLLYDPDTQWPTDISPEFYEVLKDFMELCKELALRLLKVLGVGMNLVDTDELVKRHSLIHKKNNFTTFRSLYYPLLPDASLFRLGEHSDYGSISLLFQDDVGGLQLQSMEGKYIDATPIENTVLINIGDTLEFWSGNKLKSTKHRVVGTSDPEKQNRIRRSLVYFVFPNNDVLIDEELVSEGNAPKQNFSSSIPRMTALDYLKKKFQQTYQVKSKLT